MTAWANSFCGWPLVRGFIGPPEERTRFHHRATFYVYQFMSTNVSGRDPGDSRQTHFNAEHQPTLRSNMLPDQDRRRFGRRTIAGELLAASRQLLVPFATNRRRK